MKSKSVIRYLGTGLALCTMLLPLSSQAEVYWSLNLGHGLQLSHDHYQPQRSYYKKHHHRPRHHKPHRLQHYYWRHRVHQQRHYYDAQPYGFIPRHGSHYRSYR